LGFAELPELAALIVYFLPIALVNVRPVALVGAG
jgi:hypothetical protein